MRSLATALLVLVAGAWAGAARADIDTAGITVEQCEAPTGAITAGLPRSILCDVRNASLLDEPHRLSAPTRAGSYGPRSHPLYLNTARSALGETRYRELLDLYLAGEFLSGQSASAPSEWAIYQVLLACAANGDAGCAADAAALVAGKLEEAIPELIATRIDAGPTPSSFGLAADARGFDASTGVPSVPSADGLARRVLPALHGGDRVLGTADDLPFLDPAGNGLTRVLLDGTRYVGSTWDSITNAVMDLKVFESVVAIDGTTDARNGEPLVLYGEVHPLVLAYTGCVSIGGTPVGVTPGVPNPFSCDLPSGGSLPSSDPQLALAGCESAREAQVGGTNANGRCIQLNLFGTVLGSSGVHVDVLPAFGDPAFRPAGAATFPEDLTDLVHMAFRARTPPARPANPLPGIEFPISGSSGRRVDPDTGAPVRRSGPLECLYRAADGSGTSTAVDSAGPDGDPLTESDNPIPSVGNCLLWDDPLTSSEPQHLRGSQPIATEHPADQTLSHAQCTATFDPDTGSCGIDAPNDPRSAASFGLYLTSPVFSGPLLLGIRTLRLDGDPYAPEVSPSAEQEVIGPLDPSLPPNENRTFELAPGQAALLACGPAFASACGTYDLNFRYGGEDTEGSVEQALGVDLDSMTLGPDLANADLGVVTQESTIRKGGAPGELVGSNVAGDGDYFQAGIAAAGLTPSQVLSLGPSGAATAAGSAPTDAWVEPAPWALDPFWADQGVILYQAASQNRLDPRCSTAGPAGPRVRDLDPNSPTFGQWLFTPEEAAYCSFRNGTWVPNNPDGANIRNDPSDPTNPLNVFIPDYEVAGEICQPFMAVRTPAPLGENTAFLNALAGGAAPVAFDDGCTELERFSANLERQAIATELFGSDRQFDPFETVAELECWLDGDPSNDGDCDPIAGGDGIFTLNARVFNTTENDAQVVVNGIGVATQTFLQAIGQNFNPNTPGQDEDFFFGLYDPDTCGVATSCHLRLNNADRRRDPLTGQLQFAVTALPLSTQARRADNGFLVRFSPLYLARKDPEALARLFAGETVTVDTLTIAGVLPIFIDFSQRNALLDLNIDNDSQGIRDLDQDRDGAWDGGDDFSPGPRALFDPACGSGIPGDILQDAIQLELWSDAEEAAFAAAFPDGLPPRSPVFCPSLNTDLGLTVETAPGRREAVWHQVTDDDADGLRNDLDGCPSFPNSDTTDTNGDGIPDVCQCADWNDNGTLDNGDLVGMFRCVDGQLDPATCAARLASGKAEANDTLAFEMADLTDLFEVLTGSRGVGTLTCANRPDGTPAP